MDGKLKDEIRMALRQLSHTPPKRRSSGARKIVEEHYDEIRAVLEAGHGYAAVARTFSKLGIKVTGGTIARHYKAQSTDREDKRKQAEKSSK